MPATGLRASPPDHVPESREYVWSYLDVIVRMGCREEPWGMVNTLKVDQARGTV